MILDELASYAKTRVANAKLRITEKEIKDMAFSSPAGTHRFRNTLKKSGISFICEIKKASPSKGIIDKEFDYLKIAEDYENAGADCISCLTEPRWFLGTDEIFKAVRNKVSIPMLRKDFTVDEYQIYEAKCMGADAVLLICAILTPEQIKRYLEICDRLGIDALVEAHNEEEINSALTAGAEIIGVNNRNLKNFTMNLDNAVSLRDCVPKDKIFVAESGIKTPDDIKVLRESGVSAVLVGETLMRADDKNTALKMLKGELI